MFRFRSWNKPRAGAGAGACVTTGPGLPLRLRAVQLLPLSLRLRLPVVQLLPLRLRLRLRPPVVQLFRLPVVVFTTLVASTCTLDSVTTADPEDVVVAEVFL